MMTKDEQKKIDDAVFKAVRDGNNRLSSICAVVRVGYRDTDRSLQRLRKSGRLEYVSIDGWKIC